MATFLSFMKEHPHFNNKHHYTGDHLPCDNIKVIYISACWNNHNYFMSNQDINNSELNYPTK